jgi:hypothetical protein
MAELGMAKRRKKAKAQGVEVKDLVRETSSEPVVSRADITSLEAHLASLEGSITAIRESLPDIDSTELAVMEAKIVEQVQTVSLITKLVGEIIGRITITEQKLTSIDIGKYQVEEFPII